MNTIVELQFNSIKGSKFEFMNNIFKHSNIDRPDTTILSILWGLLCLGVIITISLLKLDILGYFFFFQYLSEAILLLFVGVYIENNYRVLKTHLQMDKTESGLLLYEHLLVVDIIDTILCWFIVYDLFVTFIVIAVILFFFRVFAEVILFEVLIILYTLMMIGTIIIKKISFKLYSNINFLKIDNVNEPVDQDAKKKLIKTYRKTYTYMRFWAIVYFLIKFAFFLSLIN